MPPRKTNATRLFQCSVEGCGRYFKSLTLRSEHDKKCHAAFVKCPRLGCKRSLRPAFLDQHLFLHDKIHDLNASNEKEKNATKCVEPVVQNSTLSNICQRIEKKIRQVNEDNLVLDESEQQLCEDPKVPDEILDSNLTIKESYEIDALSSSNNETETKIDLKKKDSVPMKLRIKDCQIIQKSSTQLVDSMNSNNVPYYKIIKVENPGQEQKIVKPKPKRFPKMCKKKSFQSNQKIPVVIKRGSYELKFRIDKNKLRGTPVPNNYNFCDRIIKHPIQQLRNPTEVKEKILPTLRRATKAGILESPMSGEIGIERPKNPIVLKRKSGELQAKSNKIPLNNKETSFSIKDPVHLPSLTPVNMFQKPSDKSITRIKKVLFGSKVNEEIQNVQKILTSEKTLFNPEENDELQFVVQDEEAAKKPENMNEAQAIAEDELAVLLRSHRFEIIPSEEVELYINSFFKEKLDTEFVPECILPEVQYEVTILGSENSMSPGKTESLPDLNNYSDTPCKLQTLETQSEDQKVPYRTASSTLEKPMKTSEPESPLKLQVQVMNEMIVPELETFISPTKVEPDKETQSVMHEILKTKQLSDINDNLSSAICEEDKWRKQSNFVLINEKSETMKPDLLELSEDSSLDAAKDGFEFVSCHDLVSKEVEEPLPLTAVQKKRSIKSVRFQEDENSIKSKPTRFSERIRNRSIENSELEEQKIIVDNLPQKRKAIINDYEFENSKHKKSKMIEHSYENLELEGSKATENLKSKDSSNVNFEIEDSDIQNLQTSVRNSKTRNVKFESKNITCESKTVLKKPKLENFDVLQPNIQNFEGEDFGPKKQSVEENLEFEILNRSQEFARDFDTERPEVVMNSESKESKNIAINPEFQDFDLAIPKMILVDQKVKNLKSQSLEREDTKNSKPKESKTIWKISNFIKIPKKLERDSDSTVLQLRRSKRVCEDFGRGKPKEVSDNSEENSKSIGSRLKKSIKSSEKENCAKKPSKNLQKPKLESEGYKPKRSKITSGFRFKKTSSQRSKTSEAKVMCPHKNCGAYLTKNYLRQHIKVLHNNQRSQCNFCDKIVGPSHIRSHEKLCKQNKARITQRSFACSIKDCSASFKTSSEVYRHTWHVHRKPEPCPIKGCHSLVKPAGMRKHIKACHEPIPMAECPHCGKQLKKKSLNQHMRGCAMTTTERNFKCQVENCSATFRMQHEVNGHMWRVHQERVQCPIEGCTKIMNPIHLERHIKFAHDKVRVNCQKCGKLMAESSLPGHRKTCSGVSKYECPRKGCKKVFKISSELAKHVDQVHHSAFPCQHEGCDRIFLRQSVLNRHERMIHKKPIEICPYCKEEVRASYLYKHKLICNKKDCKIHKN